MKEQMKQKVKRVKEKLRALLDKKVNPVWAVLSVVCILAVVVGIIWNVADKLKKQQAQNVYEKLVIEMQEEVMETDPVSEDAADAQKQKAEDQNGKKEEVPVDPYEKKVDFSKLQTSVESNIYAWIYIPDTMIDYPILQHPSDNNFYLNHNLNGSEGYPGCIYTENYNSKDFTDRNTVIYGHNMKNGTMFGGVHLFKDKEYVELHPYVYIYLPGKMYIYEIFAAYEYGNAHLISNQELYNSRVAETKLSDIKSNVDNNGFYKDGVEIAGDSNIITLSTCISGKEEKRFLLQAVLTDMVDRE